MREWNSQWRALGTCRQTKLFFPNLSPSRSKQILLMERPVLGKAIQFLTGHCWMRRHQNIIDGVTDPTCRLCTPSPSTIEEEGTETYHYEESPEHIMWYCKEVKRLRERDNMKNPNVNQWEIEDLLWLLEREEIQEIMSQQIDLDDSMQTSQTNS